MANMNITKRVIREAFVELLNERALSKITVKDITDRCGINRNTFYYHYQDVPALVEEICSIQVDRIVQDYPTLNSLDGCIQAAMKFVMENKRAIAHLYYSDNRSTYVSALWRICEQAVRTYVDTVFPEDELSGRDREIIIRYHKCECFGLIIDWISNAAPSAPQGLDRGIDPKEQANTIKLELQKGSRPRENGRLPSRIVGTECGNALGVKR